MFVLGEDEIGLVKFSDVRNFQRIVNASDYARDDRGNIIPRSQWPKLTVRFPPVIFYRIQKRRQEVAADEFYAELHSFALNAIVVWQKVLDVKVALVMMEGENAADAKP